MLEQALKYAIVGLANTAAGLALIYAGMAAGLSPSAANVCGYLCAFLLSYVLNRRWTFASAAPARRSLPRYAAVCAGGWLVNLAVLNGAIHAAGVDPWTAQILAAATYAAFVFFVARVTAFRS